MRASERTPSVNHPIMRSIERTSVRVGAYLLGALPDHLGQFRIAQRYWWYRRPEHQILRQRMTDGTELDLDLGDRTQGLAYLTRRYSEDLVQQIVIGLPPNGLFFDVGANVGLITFQVARRRPDVRIVAFEPYPVTIEGWKRNRRLTPSDRVTLEAVAVTDRIGSVDFWARPTDLGAGVVVPPGEGTNVPSTDLASYCAAHGIKRIDVLKVDVEGSELEVLEGASGLLSSGAVRVLLLEFNDDQLARRGTSRREMVSWLADHGMLPTSPLDAGDVWFAASRA